MGCEEFEQIPGTGMPNWGRGLRGGEGGAGGGFQGDSSDELKFPPCLFIKRPTGA